MYHLIAAVMAVALGVFMTASGLNYTGSAFSNASSKAQAIQVISAMEQIDSAWTMWESDGNNVVTTPVTSALLTASGKYLASFPSPPSIVAAASGLGVVYGFDTYTNAGPLVAVANQNAAGAIQAKESGNIGTFVVLNSATGGNTCLAIDQSAGLIGQNSTILAANLTLPNGPCTVNLNTNSGILTAANMDCLSANYKYWCVPIAPTIANNGFYLGNLGVVAATDASLYLAYMKHL